MYTVRAYFVLVNILLADAFLDFACVLLRYLNDNEDDVKTLGTICYGIANSNM